MKTGQPLPQTKSRRIVLVGRLKPGVEAQAAELIANGPPFDLEAHGFERHSVFLSVGEVVFLFEGPEVEWLVDDIVDSPLQWPLMDALDRWHAIVEGPPHMAREQYSWERASAGAATQAPR